MQGYVGPIERLTLGNRDFRRVLFTAGHMQLVLMALKPVEEIGSEVHATHDQFFRIEKGKGEIRIDGAKLKVSAGDAIVVPAGLRHNLTNTGKRRLRLYTLYAPPNHADRLVEPTRAIAEAHEKARSAAAVTDQAQKDMIDEGSPVAAVAR
ncbi:cupin domain-containing protein [Rhodobacter sp. Har01]|uniref:cupin domain-containing protein n=1 Tax=Rhodobacter sp. Har01 TaxID=2883999 RepID=UPI001D06435B|nr:cupin domain-containing protein [Rhodobacter sp. Har01]MCB6179061.1 cupin domain-containing protein [Rhodobacter sp. Har01]